MDAIFEKIANSKFHTLTLDEHKLLNIYDSDGDIYNWTKQFWTYINNNKNHIYWPEKKSEYLFEWNDKMIDYYQNNIKYTDIVEPVIVIFNYDVYLQDTRFGDMGKYVHYNRKMSPESWKIKKSLFKEIIRDGLYTKIKKSAPVDSIKIYNIRIKDHLEYDSDDDGYGFYKKDDKPDIRIVNKLDPPKIPDTLNMIL